MKDLFYGRRPYNMLIVSMSGLAQILHTLPAIFALRKRYPKTHITWFTDERFKDLLESFDEIDEILSFDRPNITKKLSTMQEFWRAVGLIWRHIKILWKKRFVLAFNFQSTWRPALFTFFSGARIRVGKRRFSLRERLCHNRHAQVNRQRHFILQHLQQAALSGADETPEHKPLQLSVEDEKPVDAFYREVGIIKGEAIFLCPSVNDKKRRYPTDLWKALIERVQSDKPTIPIVMVFMKESERTLTKTLLKKNDISNVTVAPAMPIRSLAALLQSARLVIAPDCGLLHLADWMRTPVVGLYAPSDPKKSAPIWAKSQVVQSRNKKMEEIAPETVFEAAMKLLEKTKNTQAEKHVS